MIKAVYHALTLPFCDL